MPMIWLKFFICAVLILFAGKRVAKYGDAIAEKTGLGGLWIGLVLVSIATSLPELFTGIGSTIFVGVPDLTVGNLFGANTYNLVNIAILDAIHKGSPLLSSVSSGQLLTAALSIIPISIAAAGIFLSQNLPALSFANVSFYSVLIAVCYLVSTRIIFNYEREKQKIFKEIQKEESAVFKYDKISLKTASIRYVLAASIIASAGIWLAYIGDDLSASLELSQNFVGSLFLGFVTTLPEITVSIAAVRLGAKELAVANMLGSNLFNMAIIFINDALYRKASIFKVVSQQHILTAFVIAIMTAIVMGALVLNSKKKTRFGISGYAIILILVFIVGTFANFVMGR